MAVTKESLKASIHSFLGDLGSQITNSALSNVPLVGNLALPVGAAVFAPLEDAVGEAIDAADSGVDDLVEALNAVDGIDAARTVDGGISIRIAASRTIALVDDAFSSGNLGIGLSLGGSFKTALSAALDVRLKLDQAGNLTIVDSGAAKELTIGLTSNLGITGDAELGFLDLSVRDADLAKPELSLTASIDLPTGKASDAFAAPLDPQFTGTAALDLDLETKLADGLLPSIATELVLSYDLATGAPAIAFKDVTIDIGSVLGVLAPVFGQIGAKLDTFPLGVLLDIATGPLPIIDAFAHKVGLDGTLDTVPIIKDDKISLADLAVFYDSLSGAGVGKYFEGLATVALVRNLTQSLALGKGINLGDFTVAANPADSIASFTGLLPAEAKAIFDEALKALNDPSLAGGLTSKGGLKIPILDDPSLVVGLLLNKVFDPVPIVEFDLPDLSFNKHADLDIPILGPIALTLEGDFGVGLDLGIGYDTEALKTSNFLDGIFFTNFDDAWTPTTTAPVVTLNAGIHAGVALNAVVFRASATGGITFDAGAFLDDTNHDGKLRIDEAGNCFFDVSGKASADVRVRLKFGFGPFSYTKTIPLASVVLVDFAYGCEPSTSPPAKGLATLLGSDLRLNTGPNASQRVLNNVVGADVAEGYEIGFAYDAKSGAPIPGALAVHAFGVTQSFAGPITISGDLGLGNDSLIVSANVTQAVAVHGGAGDDMIVGGAGADHLFGEGDHDYLVGNDGDDELDGGAGDDTLVGGAGADQLKGGAGIDEVSYADANKTLRIGVRLEVDAKGAVVGFGGEAEGDRLSGIDHLTGTLFDDTLAADAESDGFGFAGRVLEGLDGNDTLKGGLGDDLLVGGAGGDTLLGGAGHDGASYLSSYGGVTIDLGRKIFYGGDANGDWLDKVEDVFGSGGRDHLTGDGADNRLDGFVGDDVLQGGGGNDEVSGGEGNDIVYALGDGDTLDGGGFIDTPGVDLLSYRNRTTSGVTVDLGGGAGTGGDVIKKAQRFVADDLPTVEVPGYSSFENLVGTDLAASGDVLTGDNGDNAIWGLAGNDTINGGNGFDRLIGGAGADRIDGGAGLDWAEYRGSPAGVIAYLDGTAGVGGDAAGDIIVNVENLLGSDETDALYGNASDNVIDPLLTGAAAPYTDFVSGGAGSDTLRLDYSRGDYGGGLSLGYYAGSLTDGYGGRWNSAGDVMMDAVSFIGVERLQITGTRLADTISSGAGGDLIATGSGDDTIYSGLGDDTVYADNGNDFVSHGTGADRNLTSSDAVRFLLDGGDGIDTLSLSVSTIGTDITLSGQTGEFSGVNFVSGSGAAVAENFEILKDIWTGSGRDSLTQLGAYDNDFRTGDGADVIRPGLGFDTVNGGLDTTGLRLGYNVDSNYSYYYIEDLDAFLGSRGDTLVLDYSSLTDSAVTSFTYRSLSSLPSRLEPHVTLPNGNFLVTGDDHYVTNSGAYKTTSADVVTNSVSFTEIERLDVTGSKLNDTLAGTDIDISLYQRQLDSPGPYTYRDSSRGDDILRGMAGDDVLIGYSGNDILDGGDGNDQLWGGTKTPKLIRIFGEPSVGTDIAEVDRLTGGAGADVFVLGDSRGRLYELYGHAIITDFNAAEGDTLRLYGSASNYSAAQNGGATNVYFVDIVGSYLIATLEGVTSFSLTAPYVQYVNATASAAAVTTSLSASTLSTPLLATAQAASSSASSTAAATPTSWIVQEANPSVLLSKLVAGSGVVAGSQSLTIEGSGEGFGYFTNDPFGLGSGVVLSTGRVEDLAAPNTVSSPAGSASKPISVNFVKIGRFGNSDIYRADLSGLGVDIASIRLSDANTKTGGSGGTASGFDLDAIAFSTTRLDAITATTNLNNPSLFPRLGVIDYDAAHLVFRPGSQREPSGGWNYGPDLEGSKSSLVRNPLNTLSQFSNPTARWLTFGDGGSLGVNLNQTLSTDGPLYLYIGEYGGVGESIIASVDVSSDKIEPSGDLSTDLGAPGLEGDTSTLTYRFTPVAGADLVTFQVVIFSEELPEHAGIVDPDAVTVTLNGVSIAALSNGAEASLASLMSSPYYAGNADLILNPAGTGPLADKVAADAYTKTLTFVGRVEAGVENTLVIEAADHRDAYLDTGILIKGASFLSSGGALPTNLAPRGVSDIANVAYGVAYSGNVLANDVDPDGDALRAVLASSPKNGTVTFAASGAFTYTPKAGFFGTDSFAYRAKDAALASDLAIVTLVVARPGGLVADADGPYAATEDTLLSVAAASGVLAGDSAPTGRTLAAQLVSTTKNGALSLAADGSFTYKPKANFNGVDSFVYRASDGVGVSANATVSIVTAAANDAPILSVGAPSARLVEAGVTPAGVATPGTSAATITLAKADPDGGALPVFDTTGWKAAGAGKLTKAGVYGSVVLDTATGVLSYTLDNARATTNALAAGAVVKDAISVTVKDAAGASVTKTANFVVVGADDAPTLAVGAPSAKLVESGVAPSGAGIFGMTTAAIELAKGDPDAGDAVAFGAEGWKAAGFGKLSKDGLYGSVVLDVASGRLTYTLDNAKAATNALKASTSAEDAFSVTVKDRAGATTTRIARFAITGSNDAPTAIVGSQDRGLIESGSQVVGVATAAIVVAKSDRDAGGVANFDPTGWTAAGASALTKVGVYGSVVLDTATGRLGYKLDNARPATNALAGGALVEDKFVVKVKDANGASLSRTVRFSIAGTNDAPTLTVGAPSVKLIEAGVATAGVSTSAIVLSKADPDKGDVVVFDPAGWTAAGAGKLTKLGAYGSVVLDTATGRLTYALDNARPTTNALAAGASVADNFAIVVKDAAGVAVSRIASFTVLGSNDAPTLTVGAPTARLVETGTGVAGTPSATIALTKAGPDRGDTVAFVTAGWTAAGAGKWSKLGAYGSVILDTATGRLTYTLDNGKAATNDLETGDTRSDSFSITVRDAKGAAVTKSAVFAIVGTGDGVTINGSAGADLISAISTVRGQPFPTKHIDRIFGNAGDDRISGLGGKDTIDGGGGLDTASYSEKATAVVATLNGATNAIVTVGGVAEDTIRNIENITGGAAGDTFTGDALANVFSGRAGADRLDGGAGLDTADYSEKTSAVAATLNGAANVTVTVGGVAEDTIRNIENITGGAAGDTFTGDALANVFSGRAGADRLDGGAGLDTADYSEKNSGVAVTLNGATNAVVTVGGVAEDTIRNIENIAGGAGGDRLTGDSLANVLIGNYGNDVLKGAGGSDTLDGGDGADTADYSDKTAAVVTTLNGQTYVAAVVGGVAEDTIRNIENLIGGSAGDTFTGDGFANVFSGRAGADELDGGAGADTADYSEKRTAVVATLNRATNAVVTVGGVAEDTIRNIENLIGGSAGDTLTGDALANVFSGRGGADKLDGGAGIDTADYSEKASAVVATLKGATNAVVTVGGGAEDTIRNIESLVGGSAGDTFTGDDFANVFTGRGGADKLDGGAGLDTASYADKAKSVAVTLNGATDATVTVDGIAEDTIRNIENITGGSANDRLTGDSLANVLIGNGGDDILKGAGGVDTLDGGAGSDTADYSEKASAIAATLSGAIFSTVTVGGVAEDKIRNIENLVGGSAGDTLTGDGAANVLTGGRGADRLDGGANLDTASYAEKTAAVVVTLSGATDAAVTVGGVAEDAIKNIENLVGGSAADRLRGDGFANVLIGNDGDDLLQGAGGFDTLDGGAGVDTADFSDKTASVAVALSGDANAIVTVGGAAEDVVRNIENVIGGAGSDRLTGDGLANVLAGGAGNDTLAGGGGADVFVFRPSFGHDAVLGFGVDDKLRVDRTIFADWSHLIGAAQQVGVDVLITASAADSILLQNVALGTLTQTQAQFF